ncbi:MAG TPA: hypothetical protein VNJ70_07845 [Thermoanaerobaculia bacterium]|nr:hypothetical protein [Thermoanaerobaculia bacterium]
MSDTAANPPTKVVVYTALISAVSTIAVSFMGVIPMLRSDEPSAPNAPLQSSMLTSPKATATEPPIWRIEGKVHNDTVSEHVGAELFLVRADSLKAHTDAAGRFVFDEVPEGYYWLQVTVAGESSNRYFIAPSTTRGDEQRVEYFVMQKKGEPR